jgi:hypothetical protein
VTRTSWQRPATLQPDTDADVLKLEFDNRWEGPGDAFQTIVGSMVGLEVQVTPPMAAPGSTRSWLATIANKSTAMWTRLRWSRSNAGTAFATP